MHCSGRRLWSYWLLIVFYCCPWLRSLLLQQVELEFPIEPFRVTNEPFQYGWTHEGNA